MSAVCYKSPTLTFEVSVCTEYSTATVYKAEPEAQSCVLVPDWSTNSTEAKSNNVRHSVCSVCVCV